MNLINRDALISNKINTKDSSKENLKVLGIIWEAIKDHLNLGVCHNFEKAAILAPTKRNVLKSIASIYHPIGFLQNIVINLKILFQEICLSQVGWDDITRGDLRINWDQIIGRLKIHKDLEFARYYFAQHISDPTIRIYLHGFSDASELAYASCIYLKYVTKMGSIGITFVTAKSRIVPSRKQITVPRIELLGNCILARLMSSVREAIREEIAVDNFLCWSDSMISLAWIKSAKELKVFEENRVQDIRKPVNPNKWFHCKSEENPADVITRFNYLNEKKEQFVL